jgi:hypothetical protein
MRRRIMAIAVIVFPKPISSRRYATFCGACNAIIAQTTAVIYLSVRQAFLTAIPLIQYRPPSSSSRAAQAAVVRTSLLVVSPTNTNVVMKPEVSRVEISDTGERREKRRKLLAPSAQ